MVELGYTKCVAQGDKWLEHVCYMCRGLLRIQALFELVFTRDVLCVC